MSDSFKDIDAKVEVAKIIGALEELKRRETLWFKLRNLFLVRWTSVPYQDRYVRVPTLFDYLYAYLHANYLAVLFFLYHGSSDWQGSQLISLAARLLPSRIVSEELGDLLERLHSARAEGKGPLALASITLVGLFFSFVHAGQYKLRSLLNWLSKPS